MINANKKHVVVIPGLGGESATRRVRKILRRWRNENTDVFMFESEWSANESFEDKLLRLVSFFDEHTSEDTRVVAYSAGGALAISLIDKRPDIKQTVLVSSKLKGSNTIGTDYQKRAPALLPAVQASEGLIKGFSTDLKNKIVCMKPIFDEVVPKKDMNFEGAKTVLIPSFLHAPSIGVALIFRVGRYLK